MSSAAVSGEDRLTLLERLFVCANVLACIEIRVAGALTLYDLTLIALFGALFVVKQRIRFWPPSFALPLLVFFIFCVFSTLRAPQPTESITQTLQFLFIFVVQLPVVLTLANRRKALQWSVVSMCLGALGVIATSYYLQPTQGSGRVLAFYSDGESRVAYPTAYLLPFGLQIALAHVRTRPLLVTALGGAAAYLALWSLTASGSRSAFAGAVVSFGLFICFRDGFQRGAFRVIWRGAATAAVAAGLGYYAWSAEYLPQTLFNRLERTAALESSLIDDRTSLAEAAWRAFTESPLFGVGLDNFRHVATTYNSETTSQLPHNLWLQFLTSVGLPGTLAVAWVLILWYMLLIRARRGTDETWARLGSAFLVSMTAILTIYLFVPIMIQRQYWTVFALGLSWSRLSAERSKPAHIEERGLSRPPSRRRSLAMMFADRRC